LVDIDTDVTLNGSFEIGYSTISCMD